MNPNGSDEILK